MHTAKNALRAQQRKLDAADEDYQRQCAQLEELEAQTETVRTEIQQLNVEVERANNGIRALTQQMAGADGQVAVLENDIAHDRKAEE